MSDILQKPQMVDIFDTTLRDGAQSPGIALSGPESLRIAHQLDHLGVDVIEAGFPNSSPENFSAVRAIAVEIGRPVIAGLARANAEDIDKAAKALAPAERPRIHTFISTSDIHIEHQMGNSREDVKGLARAAVAQAKGYVDDVEFSPMDATRADVEFTAEVVQIAIDEGATVINIPDTVGYTQPDEYRAYLGRLYQLVPDLGDVTLSVHCHDDLGLANANSFAGVQAGARQVECAVNGLGERAGNTALEEIVMLLRTRREIDGFDTRVDATQLGPTSRLVSRLTRYPVPKNKGVVGQNAFQHESGIHQAGVLKNRSTFEIMSSTDVGVDVDPIVLGKQSGRNAVDAKLKEEGVFEPRYSKSTFRLFKELADKVGGISREQITEIHAEDIRRQTNTYRLEDYTVNSSKKQDVHTATIEVLDGDNNKVKATAQNDVEHPDIDGPTSALYAAINQATGTDYLLKQHEVVSLGEGKETIGKATVVLSVNGKSVTGYGISLDTHQASALAYLDAVCKATA